MRLSAWSARRQLPIDQFDDAVAALREARVVRHDQKRGAALEIDLAQQRKASL